MATAPTRTRGLRRHSSASIAAMVQRPIDVAVIALFQYVAHLARAPTAWSDSNTVALVMTLGAFQVVAPATLLYRRWPLDRMRHSAMTVLKTWSVVVPLLLFFAFITKTTEQYSRIAVLGWLALTPMGLIGSRALVQSVATRLRRRRAARQVAVLGATPIGLRIAEQIKQDERTGINLAGYYDDRGAARREPGWDRHADVLGDVDQLVEDARQGRIDSVYIALPLRAEPRINEIVRRLADTTSDVYVVPDFLGIDLLRARWSSVEGMAVFHVVDEPVAGLRAWLRRLENALTGAVRA